MSLRTDTEWVFNCFSVSIFAGFEGALVSKAFYDALRRHELSSSETRFNLIKDRLSEDFAELNQELLDKFYTGDDHDYLRSEFLKTIWKRRIKANRNILKDILERYTDFYNDEI